MHIYSGWTSSSRTDSSRGSTLNSFNTFKQVLVAATDTAAVIAAEQLMNVYIVTEKKISPTQKGC